MPPYRRLAATGRKVIASALVVVSALNPFAMFKNYPFDNVAMAGVLKEKPSLDTLIGLMNNDADPQKVAQKLLELLGYYPDIHTSGAFKAAVVTYLGEYPSSERKYRVIRNALNTAGAKLAAARWPESSNFYALTAHVFTKSYDASVMRSSAIPRPSSPVDVVRFSAGSRDELIRLFKEGRSPQEVADFIDNFKFSDILAVYKSGQDEIERLQRAKKEGSEGAPLSIEEELKLTDKNPAVAFKLAWDRYYTAGVLSVGQIVSEQIHVRDRIVGTVSHFISTHPSAVRRNRAYDPKNIEAIFDNLPTEPVRSLADLRDALTQLKREGGPDLSIELGRLTRSINEDSPEKKLAAYVDELKRAAVKVGMLGTHVDTTTWDKLNLMNAHDLALFDNYVAQIIEKTRFQLSDAEARLSHHVFAVRELAYKVNLLAELVRNNEFPERQAQLKKDLIGSLDSMLSKPYEFANTDLPAQRSEKQAKRARLRQEITDAVNNVDVQKLNEFVQRAYGGAEPILGQIRALSNYLGVEVDWAAVKRALEKPSEFDAAIKKHNLAVPEGERQRALAAYARRLHDSFFGDLSAAIEKNMRGWQHDATALYNELNEGKTAPQLRRERVDALYQALTLGVDILAFVPELAHGFSTAEFWKAMGTAVAGGLYDITVEPLVRPFAGETHLISGEPLEGSRSVFMIPPHYVETWWNTAWFIGTDVILPVGSLKNWRASVDASLANPTPENVRAASLAFELFLVDLAAFNLPVERMEQLAKGVKNANYRELLFKAIQRAADLRLAAINTRDKAVQLARDLRGIAETKWRTYREMADEPVGTHPDGTVKTRIEELVERFGKTHSWTVAALLARREILRDIAVRKLADELVNLYKIGVDEARAIAEFQIRILGKKTSSFAEVEGIRSFFRLYTPEELAEMTRIIRRERGKLPLNERKKLALATEELRQKMQKTKKLTDEELSLKQKEKTKLETDIKDSKSKLGELWSGISDAAKAAGIPLDFFDTGLRDILKFGSDNPTLLYDKLAMYLASKETKDAACRALRKLAQEIKRAGGDPAVVKQVEGLIEQAEKLVAAKELVIKVDTEITGVARSRFRTFLRSVARRFKREGREEALKKLEEGSRTQNAPIIRERRARRKLAEAYEAAEKEIARLEKRAAELPDELKRLDPKVEALRERLLKRRQELEAAGKVDELAAIDSKLERVQKLIDSRDARLTKELEDISEKLVAAKSSIEDIGKKMLAATRAYYASPFLSALTVPPWLTALFIKEVGRVPGIGEIPRWVGPLLPDDPSSALFALSNSYLLQRTLAEALEEAATFSTPLVGLPPDELHAMAGTTTSTASAGVSGAQKFVNPPAPQEVDTSTPTRSRTSTVPVLQPQSVQAVEWKNHPLIKNNSSAIDMITGAGAYGGSPLVKPGLELDFLTALQKAGKTWPDVVNGNIGREFDRYLNL